MTHQTPSEGTKPEAKGRHTRLNLNRPISLNQRQNLNLLLSLNMRRIQNMSRNVSMRLNLSIRPGLNLRRGENLRIHLERQFPNLVKLRFWENAPINESFPIMYAVSFTIFPFNI